MSKNLIRKECKFVTHIPKTKTNQDTHLVKLLNVYDDGSIEPSIELIHNFKRPYYITKPAYRNHQQKKESESIHRVDTYTATQSDLFHEIGKRIGKYRARKAWDIADNPYVYGTTLDASSIIKAKYHQKYSDTESYHPFTYCIIDIEHYIDHRNDIMLFSATMGDKLYTAILSSFLADTPENRKELESTRIKYLDNVVPQMPSDVELEFFDTDIDVIRGVFRKIHQWKPDFLVAHSMRTDIGYPAKRFADNGLDFREVINDPDIPRNLWRYEFKEDNFPNKLEDRYDVVECSASFYCIDNMFTYKILRATEPLNPKGYGLTAILSKEVGTTKVEIEGTPTNLVKGDKHKYQAEYQRIPYAVYNQGDVVKLREFLMKAKDLSHKLPSEANFLPFHKFSKSTAKAINEFDFFYLERKKILAQPPSKNGYMEINPLTISNWIAVLDPNRMLPRTYSHVKGDVWGDAKIYKFVIDSDQVGAYPSDYRALNISVATCEKELISIGDLTVDEFREENINLVCSTLNQSRYAMKIAKAKSPQTLFDF